MIRSTVPPGQRGQWRVERFTVSDEEAALERARACFSFSSRGRATPAGTYTRLMRRGQIVMSDTPDELSDFGPFVRAARDHVLINGLGLGCCLAAVLAKPAVTAVTVIEIDPDVVALIAPAFAGEHVDIIVADAMTWQPPRGSRYGAVWHDIWDDICADNLPQMRRLHRRYGRRAMWQGSWGRSLTERLCR